MSITLELTRELLRFSGDEPGPLVIISGGIHGNEIAGLKALERIKKDLKNCQGKFKGTFIGIRGNLESIKKGIRYQDTDLNRIWTQKYIDTLSDKANLNAEDNELLGILEFVNNEIEDFPHKDEEIIFLDLHTTSANNGVFSIVPSDIKDHPIPSALDAPVILGLADKLQGTAIKYFAEKGVISFAFEAGYHESPDAIDNLEAATWHTLHHSGFLKAKDHPNFKTANERLKEVSKHLPKFVDLIYHHIIKKDDGFEMVPGINNFQEIKKNQVLAYDKNGPIKAPKDCLILMPLYQDQGCDGFFLVSQIQK
jgi:succinylglutamate desuccinylase